MTLYSIYARPEKGPEHLSLVGERFIWTAFLLTPFWALGKGAWGFFILWLAVVAALVLMGPSIGADAASGLYFLFALWAGFAAPQIAARALLARNWIAQGTLPAGSAAEAERVWLEKTYGARP